jgi:GAF domain-containing protein
VTLIENEILSESVWDDVLIEAAQKGEPIVRQANGRPGVMALPVVVRGEVIGAIEVELNETTDWQTSLEMLNAVSERLATSLENARLFEEARAATAQEQLINQLVTQYQASPSVDDLLRITLTELSNVLGAERGAIRLGRAPENNGGAG